MMLSRDIAKLLLLCELGKLKLSLVSVICAGSNAGKCENIHAIVGHCLGYLYGKCVWRIGLKSPGNYSDQFRFNEMSISLCEGPYHELCI